MARVYVGYDKYGLDGIDDELIQFVFDIVVSLTKLDVESEAGLVITTDERMRELNKKYRGKDMPTNILSFAYAETAAVPDAKASVHGTVPEVLQDADGKNYLGDVFISRAQLVRDARAERVSLKEKFIHLLAHGLLHLAGIHHPDEQAALRMEELEDKVIEAALSA